MYLYIYVYTYLHVYTHPHTYTHAHTHTQTYTHKNTHTHTRTHTQTPMRAYINAHARIYTRMCISCALAHSFLFLRPIPTASTLARAFPLKVTYTVGPNFAPLSLRTPTPPPPLSFLPGFLSTRVRFLHFLDLGRPWYLQEV